MMAYLNRQCRNRLVIKEENLHSLHFLLASFMFPGVNCKIASKLDFCVIILDINFYFCCSNSCSSAWRNSCSSLYGRSLPFAVTLNKMGFYKQLTNSQFLLPDSHPIRWEVELHYLAWELMSINCCLKCLAVQGLTSFVHMWRCRDKMKSIFSFSRDLCWSGFLLSVCTDVSLNVGDLCEP